MYFELLTAVTLRAISGPMNLWCSRVAAAAVRMLTNSDIENGETQTTTTKRVLSISKWTLSLGQHLAKARYILLIGDLSSKIYNRS